MSAYRVRPARRDDLPALAAIERAANTLFAGHAVFDAYQGEGTPIGEFIACCDEQRLFVATEEDGPVVGFAIASTLGGAHLQEVDVHPDHGRRGVGAALVEAVARWARARGAEALTLTTLSDVPWNAPYYERLGFRRLAEEELGEAVRTQLRGEIARGLGATRVAMRRALGPEPSR